VFLCVVSFFFGRRYPSKGTMGDDVDGYLVLLHAAAGDAMMADD
jgi:hypothetical protein